MVESVDRLAAGEGPLDRRIEPLGFLEPVVGGRPRADQRAAVGGEYPREVVQTRPAGRPRRQVMQRRNVDRDIDAVVGQRERRRVP